MSDYADPNVRCHGLPLVGRRPLTDDERLALRRLVNRSHLVTLGVPGLGLLFLLLLTLLTGLSPAADGPWLGVLLVGMILAVALPACLWWDQRRVVGRARADLAAGCVWRFVGQVPEEHSAELLTSGTVLRLDGEPAAPLARQESVSEFLARQFGPDAAPAPRWWSAEAPPPRFWCEALPQVAQRALSTAEHAELLASYRRHRRRCVLALVTPPCLLGLTVALANSWCGLVTGLASLVSLPVGLAMANDERKWLAALRLALTEGTLRAFELRLEPVPGDVFSPNLELLGGGLLWAVNGWRERRLAVLATTEVAPTPAMAQMAANFMVREEFAPGQSAQTNVRDLSSDELDELRAILRRTRPLRLWPTAIVFVGLALRNLWVALASVPSAGVWALVCGWLGQRLTRVAWQQTQLHRRLAADLALGRLRQLAPGEWPEASRQTGVPLDAPYVEILPHSGLLWSVAGEPALWRRSHSAL